MDGLDSLPRYSYDPRTQTYRLMTPQEKIVAEQQGPLDYTSGGGGGSTGPSGTSSGTGSGGVVGDVGLGLMGLGQSVPGIAGMVANAVGGMMADAAINAQAQTNAALAQANAQAQEATVSQGLFGPTVSTTTSIAPVAPPAPVSISSIPATDALTAMNAAPPSTSVANSPAAVAASVADSISAVADAMGIAPGVGPGIAGPAAGPGADGAGGGGAGAGADGVSGTAGFGAAADSVGGAGPGADGGGGGSSGGGGCFLTTAAVKHLGQKDDGDVLNTLRRFRDTYMRKDKEKSKDVAWYYINSPKIMRELDKHEDAHDIYKELYADYILPAYREIKDGNNEAAYEIYKDLVQFAKLKSGIDSDDLTPKPKHTAEKNMRGGGITSMGYGYAQGGMPDVARHVQSQGRGDDKVLVHMTPGEVQGLQYLAMRHGGSLTINPRTGLVEAGFLSSILPMVAGAALAPLTAGTSLAFLGSPMAAGLLVGGVTGLATGSLKKGLMAGLGAFGGAGLGAGLSAAGATAPAVTGTPAALTGAGEVAASNIVAPAFEYAPVGFNTGAAGATTGLPGFPAADAARMFGTGAPGAETFAGIAPPPTTAADIAARANAMNIAPGVGPGIATPPAPPTFGQGVQQMGRGFSNIFDFQNQAGTEARKAFLGSAATKTAPATGVGGMSGLLKYGGAAAAPMIAASMGPDQSVDGDKFQPYIRPFKYDPGRQDVTYRTGERGESTAEQLYFSPRYTPMGVFKPGEEPTYGSYAMGGGINMGGRIDPDYNENVDRNAAFSDDFYGGGLTALAVGGKPKEPRFLMGKGDGMSDSIPATINDVQPARLADGEFVIPADVVSHLGNGSSKAGAAKLHSMMKRIRHARTGKKRQAPEVKAERYMPA